MEYCDFGDLRDFISFFSRSGKLAESDARYIIREVLKGLYHLSVHCGIMHRDLKIDNVLVK